MTEIVVKSAKETRKIAEILAEEVKKTPRSRAMILALAGNLGAGKTTFVQGFATAFGIKEKITSPTFVLLKIYNLGRKRKTALADSFLVHTDCYRLNSPRDLIQLGFKKILEDKNAIILIEWADKIGKILPAGAIWIKFEHGAKNNERIIKF